MKNPIRHFIPVPSPPEKATTLEGLEFSVNVLRLRPDDVVVVSSDYFLTAVAMDELREKVCGILPKGTKVLLLDRGMSVGVVRSADDTAA